jgi:hypothetical protein
MKMFQSRGQAAVPSSFRIVNGEVTVICLSFAALNVPFTNLGFFITLMVIPGLNVT